MQLSLSSWTLVVPAELSYQLYDTVYDAVKGIDINLLPVVGSSRRRVPTLPLTLPTLPWTSHLTPTWKSFDKVHKISIRGKLYPLINSPHKNLYIIVMLSIIIQNMLTLSSRIAKMLSALQQSLCPPFRQGQYRTHKVMKWDLNQCVRVQ
jgi:hypothetical protein